MKNWRTRADRPSLHQLCVSKTLHVNTCLHPPLHLVRPLHLMKKFLARPLHLVKKFLARPLHLVKKFLARPLHIVKKFLARPLYLMKKCLAPAPCPNSKKSTRSLMKVVFMKPPPLLGLTEAATNAAWWVKPIPKVISIRHGR